MKLIEKVTGMPKKAKEKVDTWIEEHPIDFAIYALLIMGAVGGGTVGYAVGSFGKKSKCNKAYANGWNDNEHHHWDKLCDMYDFPNKDHGWHADNYDYRHTRICDIAKELEEFSPEETFSGRLVRDSSVKQLDSIEWPTF